MTPTIYPDLGLFQEWITKAKKRIIIKGARDRYKQSLLYVNIDKNAQASSKPSGTIEEAECVLSTAKDFKSITEVALEHFGVQMISKET